jgi:hypothetical protein
MCSKVVGSKTLYASRCATRASRQPNNGGEPAAAVMLRALQNCRAPWPHPFD